jgi:YD repeat-containing protein
LLSVIEKKSSGTTIFSETYVLNPDGTRASAHEQELQSNNSTTATIDTTWTYDADDRLIGETINNSLSGQIQETWTYDLAGKRTKEVKLIGGGNATTNYTYNGDNELVTQNSTSLTYDNNGSLTDDGTHKYVYDLRNKLVKITDESGNVNAT